MADDQSRNEDGTFKPVPRALKSKGEAWKLSAPQLQELRTTGKLTDAPNAADGFDPSAPLKKSDMWGLNAQQLQAVRNRGRR